MKDERGKGKKKGKEKGKGKGKVERGNRNLKEK